MCGPNEELEKKGIASFLDTSPASSYGLFFYNASVKGNLTALSSLTFLT